MPTHKGHWCWIFHQTFFANSTWGVSSMMAPWGYLFQARDSALDSVSFTVQKCSDRHPSLGQHCSKTQSPGSLRLSGGCLYPGSHAVKITFGEESGFSRDFTKPFRMRVDFLAQFSRTEVKLGNKMRTFFKIFFTTFYDLGNSFGKRANIFSITIRSCRDTTFFKRGDSSKQRK